MRSAHQTRVEQFMRLAGQRVPQSPVNDLSGNIRLLRAKLIYEEAMETVAALGVDVFCGCNTITKDNVAFEVGRDMNIIEVIDGCCDVSVVTTGTLSALGVPDLPFIAAVDNNNLAKFGPGHSIRMDGKLIKPPGHKPPPLAEILAAVRSLAAEEEGER